MGPDHSEFLQALKERIAKASRLPWILKKETVCGFLIGTTIENPDREIAGNQGLLYGLSDSYREQVEADIEFLTNSRLDCEALMNALLAACGHDQWKAEYLYAIARNELARDRQKETPAGPQTRYRE